MQLKNFNSVFLDRCRSDLYLYFSLNYAMKVFSSYILGLFFRFSFIRKFVWFFITCVPVLILGLLLFSASGSVTMPIGWERSVFVSPAGMRAKNVSVVSSGSYVVAVYDGERNGVNAVYASVSLDGGTSYFPPVNIADLNTVIESVPKVAISSAGEVFVAWQSQTMDGTSSKIFYSSSNDFGAKWSDPQEFETVYDNEILPRVFYDDEGLLHIFYHAVDGELFNLFHAVRRQDGTGFIQQGSIMKLTSSMKGAFFPAIKFFGSYVILVWQVRDEGLRDHLYSIESFDYGKRWSGIKQVTSGNSNDASPSVEIKDGNVYLAYQSNEEANWTIKLLVRKNGEWQREAVRIPSVKSNCYAPKLAFTKDDELFVTWYDIRENNTKIFVRRYDILEDKPLDEEQKISLSNASAMAPVITTSGNRVIVFWETMSAIEAKYTDVYVAPPRVYSSTHQDGAWSRNNTAVIDWAAPQDESGIVGYATMVVHPSTVQGGIVDLNPDVQTTSADIKRTVLSNLEDGVTYFCIRAIDGAGNFSRTIRYRLQVSSNPLPMPVLTSYPNSAALEKESKTDVGFQWSIDEKAHNRLKGFLYSVSKDVPGAPATFTQDFKADFQSLEEGNYFFSVRSVDMTDQKSIIADYYFKIGDGPGIAANDLAGLIEKRKLYDGPYAARPVASIIFPFDTEQVYQGRSFRAAIAVNGIDASRIDGYSVVTGKSDVTAPPEVNQNSGTISLESLTSGKWHVSVRARYFTESGGKKLYYWTNPANGTFDVQIVDLFSPVDYYGLPAIVKMEGRALTVAFIIALLLLIVGTIGFGRRLVFYTKLIHFKTKNFLVR